MKNDYKEVTEDFIAEVLGTLSSMNDILILTAYFQNSPETNHYLSLISKCIVKSQEMAGEVKNRLTSARSHE